MLLKFSDLFDGLGTEDQRYSEICKAYSGAEVEVAGYLSQAHAQPAQVLLVDQPAAGTDCPPSTLPCLALPGFTIIGTDTPVRLRGRLSYGFALDADGNGSFLRLEGARVAAGPDAVVPAESGPGSDRGAVTQ